MADIMAGDSGHATFAPLSQAQTLSIAKHLQEQINENQARIDDFLLEYGRTKQDMHEVQQAVRNNDEVHDLQNGLAHATTLIDSCRKDLARTNSNVLQLTGKVDESLRGIRELRTLQKESDLRMSKMYAEIEHLHNLTIENRANIEKKMSTEFTNLRDDFSKMGVVVNRLKEDQDVLKQTTQESKEDLRGAALQRQGLSDEIAKSNTMIKVLDQRSAEISKCLKKTKQVVDDHANSHTKMEEDHAKLKGEVVEVFGGLKSANAYIRSLQEVIEKVNSGLKSTQTQLASSCTRWDHTRQEVEITKSNLKGLKEAHEISSARAQEMAGQLDMTKRIAQETSRGLVDTNALVLPNLNFGALTDLPRKPLTARLGDSSRPISLKPLPKKITAGSAGAKLPQGAPSQVSDRMNWI